LRIIKRGIINLTLTLLIGLWTERNKETEKYVKGTRVYFMQKRWIFIVYYSHKITSKCRNKQWLLKKLLLIRVKV
jgi:hypothetical protein